MTHFAFTALAADGRRVRGQEQACHATELEQKLQRRQLELLDCRSSLWPALTHALNRGLNRREKLHFCFHLQQLCAAGVPLRDGLADLRDSVDSPRLGQCLGLLLNDIEGGLGLAQALAQQGHSFDPLFIGLVRAGEHSGKLPEILAELTETLKWQDEMAAQRQRLLLYPACVAVIIALAGAFLLTSLVPQLKLFVQQLGGPLPWHARLLFDLADGLRHYGLLLLLLTTAGLLALRIGWHYQPGWQLAGDRLLLRLPLLGKLLIQLALSRFAHTLALLYRAGVPVLEALGMVRDVVGNRAIRQGIAKVTTAVAAGRSLTAAVQTTGLFPPLVIRMLHLGEQTGGLDTALNHVADFYRRDLQAGITRLHALLEPALTLTLGLFLGWIMLAVIGPIYQLIAQIKI
jgi:type IV pilus assembly protein PilC